MVQRVISAEEISTHMKNAKDLTSNRWWQIINMVKIQKMRITAVAKAVGVARKTVYEILNRFYQYGPDGMVVKPKGGRYRAHLSVEQEKELLDELLEDSTKGLIITGKIIHEKAEAKIGKRINSTYAYNLLHRHNWRKITPRTKHPKSNKSEQEDFKKKSHTWLKTP